MKGLPIYSKQEQIKVKLPRAAGESAEAETTFLTLSVTEGKEIYLNSRLIDRKNMDSEIKNALESRQDKTVYLSANDSLEYGYVVRILSALKLSGANVLALNVEPREE